MQIPLIPWIFQGIPESIGFVSCVVVLGTGKLNWRDIFKVAIVNVIILFFIRLIPFTPGVHVLVNMTSLILVCIFLNVLDFKTATIAIAITYAILIVLEAIILPTIVALGFCTIEEILNDNFVRIIVGYPQIILLFLTAYLFEKYDFNRFIKKLKSSKDDDYFNFNE